MKAKLIYPRLINSVDQFDAKSLLTDILRHLANLGQTNYTPPLSLLMLGAVTPPDIELQMVDERLDELNFDEKVNLVGITVTTRAVSRAREIAAEYRKRGVTVVVGGVHPSVLPEESSLYADVVVVGEGEEAWPRVLADYQRGNLKRFYRGKPQNDLDHLPFPRRELIRHPERYITTRVVATGRGCPNSCTFCAAASAVGKRRRARSVENILADLDQIESKFVAFTDDNLGWAIDFAKRLFKAIIPLNIKWIGGVSLSAFEDSEFADLIAKSGCVTLDIGFESIRHEAIVGMKKQRTNDPDRYRELIKRIHGSGVPIKGNFILGFDEDDKDTFQKLIDFVNEACIEMPSINTLIPFPGTPIFRQYEREGRLLHKNWDYYDTAGGYVVYQPKQMTRQELIDGYFMVTEELYSVKSIIHRFMGAGTFSSTSTLGGINYNLQQRRSVAMEKEELKRVATEHA